MKEETKTMILNYIYLVLVIIAAILIANRFHDNSVAVDKIMWCYENPDDMYNLTSTCKEVFNR